jgi:hypothetical protein
VLALWVGDEYRRFGVLVDPAGRQRRHGRDHLSGDRRPPGDGQAPADRALRADQRRAQRAAVGRARRAPGGRGRGARHAAGDRRRDRGASPALHDAGARGARSADRASGAGTSRRPGGHLHRAPRRPRGRVVAHVPSAAGLRPDCRPCGYAAAYVLVSAEPYERSAYRAAGAAVTALARRRGTTGRHER